MVKVTISGYVIHLRGRRQKRGKGLRSKEKWEESVQIHLLISMYFKSAQYTQNTPDVIWLGFHVNAVILRSSFEKIFH